MKPRLRDRKLFPTLTQHLSRHLRQVSLGRGRQCSSQYMKDPYPFRIANGKDDILLNVPCVFSLWKVKKSIIIKKCSFRQRDPSALPQGLGREC